MLNKLHKITEGEKVKKMLMVLYGILNLTLLSYN